MKQIPTMRSSLGEEYLTQSWLIGPTRSFLFWNSSVHQIKVLPPPAILINDYNTLQEED